ncbi:TraR/DksA C4-type zinc finger protein [Pseudomonas sp. B392_1p]|uniref:TraR/DksA C4-type zinc finger protein n=1 Tax=Pseudomonas sp. B392_1p TaxID=3457507 RepID=UPI003FCF9E31
MTGWLDQAKAYEERDRELALNAALIRARSGINIPSRAACLDCDEPISAARQAQGGVTRCVPCQTLFEKNEAHR